MLHLYSNKITEEEVNSMNKKKKKKGFTLIELIAVIAILGILAAILVPNIQGYTTKARKARAISDAKVIINAFDSYNADATSTLNDDTTLSTINTTGNIVGSNGMLKSIPLEYNTTSGLALNVTQLRNIAAGNVTLDSDGNVSVSK